jgi:hypothetical protein
MAQDILQRKAVQDEIRSYLRNNLRLDIGPAIREDSHGRVIRIKLLLEDEPITSDVIYLSED